jgi:hypothetical protein
VDPETGEVLLTKTSNEFDQPVYSLSYPAHWVYNGMAPAYQNLESILPNVTTTSTGRLNATNSSNVLALLHPGDELIDVNGHTTYWVVTDPNDATEKYLIDQAGKIATILVPRTLKVKRSGLRNTSATGVASITSLKNPVTNGRINVDASTQVLDAKAVVYSDEWGVPVAHKLELNAAPEECMECSCFKDFIFSAAGVKTGVVKKPGLLAHVSEQLTAGDLLEQRDPQASSSGCYTNFIGNTPASEVPYYKESLNPNNYQLQSNGTYKFFLVTGDIAYLGGRKVTYTYVGSQFNDLMNQSTSTSIWDGLSSCKYTISKTTDANGNCTFNLHLKDPCNGSKSSEPEPSAWPQCQPADGSTIILSVHIESAKTYTASCAEPLNGIINPYFYGIKGIWKPLQNYVYQVNRVNSVPVVSTAGSNISNTGHYSDFSSFIFIAQNGTVTLPGLTASRWVWSQKSKYYTVKGEEIESEDALNRFTAALYGYNQTLPVAIGKNTRYLEMSYDGFEDYYPGAQVCVSGPCQLFRQNCFYLKNKNGSPCNNDFTVDPSVSHTGQYSMKVTATQPLTLQTYTNSDNYVSLDNTAITTRNSNKEYILNNNYLAKGFTPKRNKDYILSFWVRDNVLSSPPVFEPKLTLTINTVSQVVNTQKWPQVEGWKRIEVKFNTGSSATLTINLAATATINIDDLRVYPADAQVKTFAYDALTQRLQAELDENNFATFYEYDDEGTLIRVKKETERGIMTLKESRQYIIKR